MKAAVSFVMLMYGTVLADIAGECDMVGFYRELGCTPLNYFGNSTTCPGAFNCPDLEDPTKCYYRGTAYSDGETIPQSLNKNSCSLSCTCSVDHTGPMFDCAEVYCVEINDIDMQKQCILTHEVGSCCSTGRICGKDAIANLKTCEVDGKTYREGETFMPKDTHKSCVCTDQWNGSIDNAAYCRDINCGIEIYFQHMVYDKCAPIYTEDSRICPIGFVCPSKYPKVIRSTNVLTVIDPCIFGSKLLYIDDEAVVDEECTTCICKVPPFVSCIKKNSC